MRAFSCLMLILVLAGCASRPAPVEAPPFSDAAAANFTALENVRLVDGLGGPPQSSQTVLLADDRIAAIFATGSAPVPRGAKRIDLEGQTVLPGLINGHVHLTPNPDREKALAAMLKNGVVVVRDLGGNVGMLSALNSAKGPLPEIVFSANMFGEGFLIDARVERASRPFPPGEAPWMKLVTPGTDLAAAMKEVEDAGAKGIKIYASLDAAEMARVTAAAQEGGLKVWVHSVIFPASAADAVSAGADQLIHAKGLVSVGASDIPDTFAEGTGTWTPQLEFETIDPGSEKFVQLFAQMRSKGIALEPALIADGDVQMRLRPLAPWQTAQRDWACAITGEASRAGVTITAGTDFFGQPGLLFDELERLQACGLSPMEVIEAATLNNARVMGIEGDYGSIEAGKRADLLVVSGDPLEDAAALRNTVMVIQSGDVAFDARSAVDSQ
ncbi:MULTISPECIES: amidohydrolase family protein [Henriciella]|jgi:imidazolonepropionase-like amidohydrolase|nr:amidohydrolase family protein [Henriciella pelagia]